LATCFFVKITLAADKACCQT